MALANLGLSNWPGMPSEVDGVLDALGGLDLAEQGGALVGRRELLVDRPGAEVVVGDLQGDAALALRVVLHAVEDGARLLRRAHHRDHDALRAHVAGAGDVVVLLGRHPHDDGDAGRFEIADRAFHRLEGEAGMLEIEEHELAAGGLEDMADARRGKLDDEMAELERAAAGHCLETGGLEAVL
jgi:hypothetical protein